MANLFMIYIYMKFFLNIYIRFIKQKNTKCHHDFIIIAIMINYILLYLLLRNVLLIFTHIYIHIFKKNIYLKFIKKKWF